MSRLFIDMSNVMKRSLFVGKDAEGIEVPDPENPEKKVWVNSWEYGFDNALTLLHSALKNFGFKPRQMVMVFDGMSPTTCRARKVSGYNKGRTKRPNEVYQALGKVKDELQKFFLELGASSVTQDYLEADDILAFLARNSEEDCMVYSHDRDMVRLAGKNAYGATVTVGNNDEVNKELVPGLPFDLVTMYKALVGDTSDNIKGAKGFGDGAFLKVAQHFGGFDVYYEIEELIRQQEIHKLVEDAEDCKPLKKLVEDEKGVYESYALATLYDNEVDTINNPLQWEHGMVRDLRPGDDTRFKSWYGQRRLADATNIKEMVHWVTSSRSPFVSIDLETATDEESDAWLAEKSKRDDGASKVDVRGSQLVSCGVTFGDNLQNTIYMTHNHAPEEGVEQLSLAQIRDAIREVCEGRQVIAHNAQGFELPVLGAHFMEDWKDNGWGGLLPNVHCTKVLASYINENESLGLKACAKRYLGYEQETYQEVTTIEEPTREVDEEGNPITIKRQYKMNELPASHVFNYGTDDTIVTAALYNHWKLRAQLEHSWKVYCEVEQLPMYLTAHAFVMGAEVSLQEMFKQEAEDDKTYEKVWDTVRSYLIEKGWEGSTCPTYTWQIDAAGIKEAFEIVTGRPLDTKVRTPKKLVALIREEGEEHFAQLLEAAIGGDASYLNDLVAMHFKGEPQLNLGSPKQMQTLLYDVMKLPIRVRNKPTDKMRKEGIKEGSPKTDELAIESAIQLDADVANVPVLKALLEMKTIDTRRKLFYGPYRHIHHPKTKKVHASANQCQTNTRRYSFADPNFQQMPKKTDGGKFRRVLLPHRSKIDPKRQTVVVSMDFKGQELVLAAEYSQDENMLSCYVGDNLKDIHSLTGTAIAKRMWDPSITYEQFIGYLEGDDPELAKRAKEIRNGKAKPVNFGEQYGAMAPKIAQTLMITEDEAQILLDAKKEMFPGVDKWKAEVVAESKEKGYVTSMMGARRHLADALNSENYMIASKAERQGPNFKIQGSGAEMTKLAMARMWQRKLLERFDCEFIAPIHDEVVWSCYIGDLKPFIKELHWCMTQPYSTMKVPIVSSISFGPNFGDQIEIGEEPTDEAIDVGIEKLYAMLGVETRQAA